MKDLLTDKEIIGAIRAGGQAAERAVGQLYHEPLFRQMAIRLASQWSSEGADAEDLLQESLWRVYDNIKKGRFDGDSSIKTYVVGVMKNISLNEYTTRKRRSEKLESLKVSAENEVLLIPEKNALLEQVLSLLPEKCKEVLTQWANGYSLEEIMHQLGFENMDAIKNKKKNCLKGLRRWMAGNPEKAKWFKNG